jgi:hypothetical protein
VSSGQVPDHHLISDVEIRAEGVAGKFHLAVVSISIVNM